jgi:hypothetical protein
VTSVQVHHETVERVAQVLHTGIKQSSVAQGLHTGIKQ